MGGSEEDRCRDALETSDTTSMEGGDGSREVGYVQDLIYMCIHVVWQCPKDIPGVLPTDYAVVWSIL